MSTQQLPDENGRAPGDEPPLTPHGDPLLADAQGHDDAGTASGHDLGAAGDPNGEPPAKDAARTAEKSNGSPP